MTQEMLIMAAILVAVILLTFIGILSRYRKCKSDEVLVVYGKTGGDKKSAKLYHGGAAFGRAGTPSAHRAGADSQAPAGGECGAVFCRWPCQAARLHD